MKAYFTAHILLLPFLTFTVLAPFGFPLAGATMGAFFGIGGCAVRYGTKIPPAFMAAQVLGVLAATLILILNPEIRETSVLAIVFSFLAGGALLSVIQGKPWTAELSAAEVGEFAQHPAFIKSNVLFSVMWMLFFAWFAFANWQELSPMYRWVPMILGGVITVIGPKVLMKISVNRGIVPQPE